VVPSPRYEFFKYGYGEKMNENSAPLRSRVSDQLEILCFLQTFTEGPNCVIGGVSKFQLTGKPVKRAFKVENT